MHKSQQKQTTDIDSYKTIRYQETFIKVTKDNIEKKQVLSFETVSNDQLNLEMGQELVKMKNIIIKKKLSRWVRELVKAEKRIGEMQMTLEEITQKAAHKCREMENIKVIKRPRVRSQNNVYLFYSDFLEERINRILDRQQSEI